MNTHFLLLLPFFLPVSLFAQPGIDGMIAAEKSFAAYAVTNNTKDAFLKYADTTGIMFDGGKAVNARQLWRLREQRPGILNWWPVWTEVAFSQDFGFSTGPWTFQPQTVKDSVVARGYFATVWHRNKAGEWQFLIDFGVNNPPSPETTPLQKWEHPTTNNRKHANEKLEDAEKEFLKLWAKSPTVAYDRFLSRQSLLHRNGANAAVRATDRLSTITKTPNDIEEKYLGAVTAPSNDMGYTYGATTRQGKTDNYLRIWRRENEGWRIAVEVLRF
jgi:hypothetical protein